MDNKVTMYNLKKISKAQNLKLVDIAAELDVRTETISQYISGEINPKVSNLVKISKMLNTTTDYLLDLTDNPNPVLSNISNEEHTILTIYKRLGDKEKGKLIGYAQSLDDNK